MEFILVPTKEGTTIGEFNESEHRQGLEWHLALCRVNINNCYCLAVVWIRFLKTFILRSRRRSVHLALSSQPPKKSKFSGYWFPWVGGWTEV